MGIILYLEDKKNDGETLKWWKGFAGLYVVAAVGFYLVTWYTWGGFEDKGHPPLWDVEEFFASSGLKFMVYFVVSYALYQLAKQFAFLPRWLLVSVAICIFLVVTTFVENWLLGVIGWAHFFGGRSVVIGYLIAGMFFALQTMLFFYLEAIERNLQLDSQPLETPEREVERLKVKKGDIAYYPELADVVSAEAYGNYCKLNIDGETYLYGAGIGKFCAAYEAFGFLRTHRGYVVNIDKISVLRQRGRQQELLLADGTVIPVGAAYRENLAAYS